MCRKSSSSYIPWNAVGLFQGTQNPGVRITFLVQQDIFPALPGHSWGGGSRGVVCFSCLSHICCSYGDCQRTGATVNPTPILYLANPDLLHSVSLHGILCSSEFGLTFVYRKGLRHRFCSSVYHVGRLFQECDNPDFSNPSVRVLANKAIITYSW